MSKAGSRLYWVYLGILCALLKLGRRRLGPETTGRTAAALRARERVSEGTADDGGGIINPSPPSDTEHSPRLRPEGLAGRDLGLDGGALEVHGGGDDAVAPPAGRVGGGEGEGEEDEEGGEGEAEVEAGGGEVVEAGPPAREARADPPLERVPDHPPRQVVERRRRRDRPRAPEDQRRHQVPRPRPRPPPRRPPDPHRRRRPQHEEPQQSRVHLPRREDARGADEPPDHGCCVRERSARVLEDR